LPWKIFVIVRAARRLGRSGGPDIFPQVFGHTISTILSFFVIVDEARTGDRTVAVTARRLGWNGSPRPTPAPRGPGRAIVSRFQLAGRERFAGHLRRELCVSGPSARAC